MDPSTGRFLSEDPARDGVLWYGYVGNNPLSFVDPTGLEAAEFYNSLGKPGADRSYEAYEKALGTGSVGSQTYHADFDDEDWERYTGIDLSLFMARSELQGRLQYLMDVEGVRPDNNRSGVYNAAELSVLELADQIYALEKAREELLPKGFRDAMLGRAFSEALNAVPLIGGVNMVIEAVRGVESFSGIRLNSTERTLRGVAAGIELIAVIAPTIRSIVKNNAFRAVLTGGMPAAGNGLKAASTPVGRLGSPLEVPRGANVPITIGERTYTGHALDQLQGRGFVPSVVEDTIRTGVRTPGNSTGTWAYVTDQAKVIVNTAGDVITVIPR